MRLLLLLPLCYRARPKPVGRIAKTLFPRAKFTRQVFCSFLSAPMCGKSRKHSSNTDVIVDFSISRAWTPHAIFLSDRNDPLWECWYNLSNLTNQRQRVNQELVYRNGSFKEMITGSAAPSVPSFLPFYFRLRAFSILGAWNRLLKCLKQRSALFYWKIMFNRIVWKLFSRKHYWTGSIMLYYCLLFYIFVNLICYIISFFR